VTEAAVTETLAFREVDPTTIIVAHRGGTPPYDETHPTYHPHADLPPNKPMAEVMCAAGWIGGVVELVEEENGDLVVVDGRQRIGSAVLAKVPTILAVVRPRAASGEDDLATFLRASGLNKHRHRTGTPAEAMSEAFEIQRLLELKLPKKAIAKLMGFETTQSVDNRVKLLSAAPALQQALLNNTHTVSDITRIVSVKGDHAAQEKALAKIPRQVPRGSQGPAQVDGGGRQDRRGEHRPA
jgi:hypothetical protein